MLGEQAMSRIEKLLERFLTVPADFTWDDLVKVLSHFGYEEYTGGKTGGSRRKFKAENGRDISLHKPHPENVVKRYALRQVIDQLREEGKLG